MGNNKICVSLGTSNIYSLKNMMNESLNINVDFIEIRFDFFNKLTMYDALESVLDQHQRAVFTCRAKNEGGKYSGKELDRVTTLVGLAAFRPMLLDVEYNTMKANDDLLDQFTSLNCDILVSWHNFEQTPNEDELVDIMDKMKEYSNNIKIVTMAKNLDDSISMLKLYEYVKTSNINLIAFCMGEYGMLSRVLCTYAGSSFTYASLAEALAPGQLTVKQMQTIYEKLNRENPELNNYNTWKERQDFNTIFKLINDSVG